MHFPELSYANPDDPRWKRWTIGAIEAMSGRGRLLPLYDRWRREIVGQDARVMAGLLHLIGVRLEVEAKSWPPKVGADVPLVMIANHPFGIGDGIAALALAEELGRPFRVLINNDLLKVPEIRPYGLPIDFSETEAAREINLKTRAEARALLRQGVTIVIFPAGGVATARSPFGRASELPWKTFTARLIQQARASVLPVYFEGQNGPLFHLVSRFSLTLRLSLLVSEFRRFVGSCVLVRVGDVVPFEALGAQGDRKALTQELYGLVHALAPTRRSARANLPRPYSPHR